MFFVEAAGCHAVAYCRVESTACLFRDHQGESDCFIKDRAGGRRDAGTELHQLALLVESGAALFDFVEPSERAGHRLVGGGLDDLNRDHSAHRDFSLDGQTLFRLGQRRDYAAVKCIGALRRAGDVIHVRTLPLGHLRGQAVDHRARITSAAL